MTVTHYDRIAVVAVAPGGESDAALLWGLRWLTERPERRLHLVQVGSPESDQAAGTAHIPAHKAESHVAAHAAKLGRQAHIPVQLEQIEGHICDGPLVAGVLRACAAQHADVLVLPAHGSGGLDRGWHTASNEELVRRAPCTVIVARERESKS